VLPNQPPFTASLFALEPDTGAVRAMVGGPGFDTWKYNIATHPPGRQTGSAFKTFVLMTALEQGYVPNDRLAGGGSFPNPGGTPDPYVVKGSGGTLTSVTLASSNGAYVRLGQIVGLENVVETAARMGVALPSDAAGFISLPLGVETITPYQMAGAFAPIANGGIRQNPYFIDRVEDAQGNVIFEREPNPTRAFSAQSACLATQILHANTQEGTGTAANIGGQPVAGKTGTTEKNGDAWFVGFSPYLTTAVWMGDPVQPTPMTNVGGITVMGGTYPARIFEAFMAAYHQGKPVREFPECEPTRSGRFIRLGGESEGETGSGGTGTGNGTPATSSPPATDDGPAATSPPTTDGPPVTQGPPSTQPPPTTGPPATDGP
jgi:penicillin-binding protein 1A